MMVSLISIDCEEVRFREDESKSRCENEDLSEGRRKKNGVGFLEGSFKMRINDDSEPYLKNKFVLYKIKHALPDESLLAVKPHRGFLFPDKELRIKMKIQAKVFREMEFNPDKLCLQITAASSFPDDQEDFLNGERDESKLMTRFADLWDRTYAVKATPTQKFKIPLVFVDNNNNDKPTSQNLNHNDSPDNDIRQYSNSTMYDEDGDMFSDSLYDKEIYEEIPKYGDLYQNKEDGMIDNYESNEDDENIEESMPIENIANQPQSPKEGIDDHVALVQSLIANQELETKICRLELELDQAKLKINQLKNEKRELMEENHKIALDLKSTEDILLEVNEDLEKQKTVIGNKVEMANQSTETETDDEVDFPFRYLSSIIFRRIYKFVNKYQILQVLFLIVVGFILARTMNFLDNNSSLDD